MEPTSRSAKGFCQGNRGALSTSLIPDSPIAGHGGEVSSVDGISIAQHISGCLVPGKRFPHLLHGPLLCGCSVTPKCSNRRRSCASTTTTNSTRKVAVGTVKKSMAAVCARWFVSKVAKSGKAACGSGLLARQRIQLTSKEIQQLHSSISAAILGTFGTSEGV